MIKHEFVGPDRTSKSNELKGDFIKMGGEVLSVAVLLTTLTLVGLGAGFLLLKIQGEEIEL